MYHVIIETPSKYNFLKYLKKNYGYLSWFSEKSTYQVKKFRKHSIYNNNISF